MSGLQGKRWYFFVWDDENVGHLWKHKAQHFEAEELFFNQYVITPNKKSMAHTATGLMERQIKVGLLG